MKADNVVRSFYFHALMILLSIGFIRLMVYYYGDVAGNIGIYFILFQLIVSVLYFNFIRSLYV